MKFAIVIISYQRAALTERCIDSVRATTTLPYRLFLVDNGSTDAATLALLDRLEGSRDIELFRLACNHGPAAGRNVALAAIPPEFGYVAMLDNDIVALPGWDHAAARAFAAGADLIQPKLLQADGLTLERGPNRANRSPLAANPEFIGCGRSANQPDLNLAEAAAIVGGTGIVKRDVFSQVGLFDERLHVAEDFDLSFRAGTAGFSLRYVPDCTLIHDHCFDFGYDQERGRPEKYLVAHVVVWRRWQKAVLSPAYLAWYGWLHRHQEPMYLPATQFWGIIHRRLRRRLVRKWIMSRHANDWTSTGSADRATEALARGFGW